MPSKSTTNNDIFMHCMFCGESFFVSDMYKATGHYDVCKNPECINDYKATVKNKLRRARQNHRRLEQGENRVNPNWMNGEFYE